MISLQNTICSGKYLCLKGVLRIGDQRNFTLSLRNEKYILVCQLFWEAKNLEIFLSEEGINHLEIFAITNDDQFLEKMHNNYLHVEFSKVNKKSEVIGLLRLPLHQFFIAYRDVNITNRLCEEQLPVISTDTWVPVLNVNTGEKIGEIECFLAIGTERQIDNINCSRKWKVNRIISPTTFTTEYLEALYSNKPTNFNCQNSNELSQINSSVENIDSVSIAPKTNKTSDLLNMLQKSFTTPSSAISLLQPAENLTKRNSVVESFRVYLEIKNARGLPLDPSLKIKKKIKRNNAGKGRHIRCSTGEQPNTYVTFQADEGNATLVKTHDGMVYSTDVIEKTSNPIWSKSYLISVSLEYIMNKNKRFILKIWRKAGTSLAHCQPLPCPMEDSVIGFAALDFSTFLANVPFISGWFNIVDFSGHINGQIKVTAHPMDDLQNLVDYVRHRGENQVDNLLDSFESSLNINNMSLSRAIKRKFTELEEISQRLQMRLLDVTGNVESDGDIEINDEQLEEFEHDLNTIAHEDEDENFGSHTTCSFTTSQTTANPE